MKSHCSKGWSAARLLIVPGRHQPLRQARCSSDHNRLDLDSISVNSAKASRSHFRRGVVGKARSRDAIAMHEETNG